MLRDRTLRCLRYVPTTSSRSVPQDDLLDEDDLLEGAEQAQNGEEGPGDPDALLGSHGAQYGGGSELLYDQFQLHSVVAKKHQIVLLDVSARVKVKVKV